MNQQTPTPWVAQGTIINATGPVTFGFIGQTVNRDNHDAAVADAAFIVKACNNHATLVEELRKARLGLKDINENHLGHAAAVVRALIKHQTDRIEKVLNLVEAK